MLVMVVSLSLVAGQADYCQISPQHTLCQYQGPGAACNGEPLSSGVGGEEAEEIVGVHNRYRSLVARGEERRGSQPSAADMRQMVWDTELASIAQMHADQCKFEHDCTSCRKTDRFGVGQNLYIYKQSVAAPANDWEKAVTDWYEEVKDFTSNRIEPFQFSSATGHYTQLVWAETDRVGCGATSYKDGRWFTTLYVCNYGPNGNFLQGEMYKTGKACSACGQGLQCSTDHPGLCVPGESELPPKSPSLPTNTISLPQQPVATTIRFPSNPTRRPTTLQPSSTTLSNFIDTEGGAELFSCHFDNEQSDCELRSKGKTWNNEDLFRNKYQEIKLESQEKTELVFDKKIPAPEGKIACVDFRFKKFTDGSGDGTLTVLAVPTRGQPGTVTIVENSPDQATWVRALVTLRNIKTQFSLVFRATGPADGTLLVALDDLAVVEGKCVRA